MISTMQLTRMLGRIDGGEGGCRCKWRRRTIGERRCTLRGRTYSSICSAVSSISALSFSQRCASVMFEFRPSLPPTLPPHLCLSLPSFLSHSPPRPSLPPCLCRSLSLSSPSPYLLPSYRPPFVPSFRPVVALPTPRHSPFLSPFHASLTAKVIHFHLPSQLSRLIFPLI